MNSLASSHPVTVSMSQLDDIQKSLRCTLVVRRPETEELYVNWDIRISTLLYEATKIQQLNLDVPYMVQMLLNRAPLLLKKRDIVKVSESVIEGEMEEYGLKCRATSLGLLALSFELFMNNND